MRKIHAMATLGKIQELKALLDSGVDINDKVISCFIEPVEDEK